MLTQVSAVIDRVYLQHSALWKPLVGVESAQGRGSTLAGIKGKKTEEMELGFRCLFKAFLMNICLLIDISFVS